jgi:hypothetical protein
MSLSGTITSTRATPSTISMLFPDEASFQRIRMNHTDADNAEAAKRATEYLQSLHVQRSSMANAGLYFAQLSRARQGAQAIELSPRLGDSMLKPDGSAWLARIWPEPLPS